MRHGLDVLSERCAVGAGTPLRAQPLRAGLGHKKAPGPPSPSGRCARTPELSRPPPDTGSGERAKSRNRLSGGGQVMSTYNGTSGNDTLQGTSTTGTSDSLNGGDGNDLIYGGNGNDMLLGGNGDDLILRRRRRGQHLRRQRQRRAVGRKRQRHHPRRQRSTTHRDCTAVRVTTRCSPTGTATRRCIGGSDDDTLDGMGGGAVVGGADGCDLHRHAGGRLDCTWTAASATTPSWWRTGAYTVFGGWRRQHYLRHRHMI